MRSTEPMGIVVQNLLTRGAKLLFSGAVVAAAGVAFLLLTAFVFQSTLKDGVHIPYAVQGFVLGASAISEHVSANFKLYLGLYLWFFGLFFAGCEILASARKFDFEALLAGGFAGSLRRLGETLAIGIGIAFIASFLGLFSRNRLAARIWMHEKGFNLIETEGWGGYLREAAIFSLEIRLMFSLYLFLTIVGVTITIVAVRAVWSIGFWGVLRYLIAVSGFLARAFKAEGAKSPFASILISLVGMVTMLWEAVNNSV